MFEQLDDATTPQEMRAAIEKATSHNAHARNVIYHARINGMTAEDTYTQLAYYALKVMIECQRALVEHINISPAKHMVVHPPKRD